MTRFGFSYVVLALAAAAALVIPAITASTSIISAGGNQSGPGGLDPGDFSTEIDNPLFPLSDLGPKLFVGEETDPDTGVTVTARLESTVLDRTRKVAGIEVLVLEEKAFAGDQLIERALDFFAQHRDGTVYYFGERVDNYENGKLVDHDGSWLAGKDGAQPGIIMPADPFVDQTYKQENAPGVAEDEARVLALNQSVRTPAGHFRDCIKTLDTSVLDPGVEDTKWYCPGVGLVRDEGPDGFIELISFESLHGAANASREQDGDAEGLFEPDEGEASGDLED